MTIVNNKKDHKRYSLGGWWRKIPFVCSICKHVFWITEQSEEILKINLAHPVVRYSTDGIEANDTYTTRCPSCNTLVTKRNKSRI